MWGLRPDKTNLRSLYQKSVKANETPDLSKLISAIYRFHWWEILVVEWGDKLQTTPSIQRRLSSPPPTEPLHLLHPETLVIYVFPNLVLILGED